ncbi:MAG TPA: phosphoribosylaminoimidazolesuccinocarboxamide synthase, partial [bacterium]|nr:phosphoribosylaminoimidazolesuccinocarboxamide synthase [bacterium]
MIPLEVVVRNVAAGSLVKRLGIPEGTVLEPPILEFYLKNDSLHDPIVNEDHIRAFGLATPEQLATIKAQALAINDLLTTHFASVEITLVDFKLEFGVDKGSRVLLADEITPDTCRLWRAGTGEKLDKDRFRFDLGDVKAGYEEVLERLRV